MSIDASGTKYWTGHGGVVLVNDPIETVEAVARAYDIRWLVLEPTDTVPAAKAIMARRAPGLARLPRRGDAAVLGRPRCAPRPGTIAARPGHEPPRGLADGPRDLPVRAGRARRRRLRRRLPEARGHRVLRGRRPQPRGGPGHDLRRALELRHPAARVPAAGLRGLAAPALAAVRDPDRPLGRDRADPAGDRAAGIAGRHRDPRCAPVRAGLAPGGGRGRGARDGAGPRADAGDRDGPDRRRLPAAPAPRRPAGLHDPVRGARRGRVPADDARAA